MSINDWGLIYKLKNNSISLSNIYLGRYLTSGISNWSFHNYFLDTESTEVKEFFLQENYSHSYKLKLLKEMGINGLEFSLYDRNHDEYRRVSEQGFKIIGYINTSVLSISRSCPMLRLTNNQDNKEECNENCIADYKVNPMSCSKKEIYPNTFLLGNVLYEKREIDSIWDGFEMTVIQNTNL